MKKILTAAFMVAALAACSQETKQETKEAAQAVASDVKDAKADAASAVDAAAVAAKEAGAKTANWNAETQKLQLEFDPSKTSKSEILKKIVVLNLA